MFQIKNCVRAAGVLFLLAVLIEAQSSGLSLPGRRGVIVDERLSAIRAAPDAKARLIQRPGRGRAVGILGSRRTAGGERYYRVAISRNRRGWILQDAVARSGHAADAEKVLGLIGEKTDDYSRAALARLCASEFRRTQVAPKCLLRLAESAGRAADRLTRDAARRLDPARMQPEERRLFFLNYSGLDRYNRLGIHFDFDAGSNRLVYDGAAGRELMRRYPRSPEAGMVYLLSGRGPKLADR